jgi:outer membrane protein assembly factor BamB
MYRADASQDRSLLIAAFLGKVFAVDRSTGQIRWRTALGSNEVVELAIGEGLVVALTASRLAFLTYATGQIVRFVERQDEAIGGRATLLIDAGQLIVAGAGAVACYSLQGDLRWTQPFKGEGHGDVAIGFPGNVRQADRTR